MIGLRNADYGELRISDFGFRVMGYFKTELFDSCFQSAFRNRKG
jgi:hypothetical protein